MTSRWRHLTVRLFPWRNLRALASRKDRWLFGARISVAELLLPPMSEEPISVVLSAAAKSAIASKIELPRGWWLEWGGQYENLQRASNRLMVLVPASLLLILVLLYNTFSSMRMALLIFGNVLLGASGGIFALILRGLTFSITAGVGFVTLFGVSVLNGVVLVSEINRLRESGKPIDEAIAEASQNRLRPILMASLVALFGFIPMALSHGDGAEVQRPLATVVIGGLLTFDAVYALCSTDPVSMAGR